MSSATLKERTEEAIAAGFSPGQLAKAAGVTAGAVSQWRSGLTKKLQADCAIGLQKLTGWSAEWWSTGHGPKHVARDIAVPDYGMAQSLSLPPFKTPFIKMEDLMRLDKNAIPAMFELAVPDGALEPGIPRGTLFVWSTERQPNEDRLVIVRDKYGQDHVREYHKGHAPGAWTAAASSSRFPSFDGSEVTILAVSKYRET